MSKILFFDIDGTLIVCNLGIYSIGEDVKESLDKLKKNGHDIFLATGRCKCFIVDEVMKYPFSGYVTCNGGYVEYLNQSVYKAIVPSKAIIATMELCDKYGFNYYFEGNDNIYVRDSNDKKHLEFCKKWGMKLETIIDHVILINQGRVVLNQPINVLQQEFSQEKLLVSCKENELLIKFLDNQKYQYTFENNICKIKTNDKINCKRNIIEYIYQNNLELNLFKEETITLEKLYQQVVEDGKNESLNV